MQVWEKVEKCWITVFLQQFVALEGWQVGSSRLAKAAGAKPSGRMKDEKLHAIARHCGANHMSKSQCTKHIILGPL